MINRNALIELRSHLGTDDFSQLRASATQAEALELSWLDRLSREWSETTRILTLSIRRHGELPQMRDDYFVDFTVEHSFAVMAEGYQSAAYRRPGSGGRQELTAGPPAERMPGSLRRLRELWDEWRKRRDIPPRQREMAKRIRQAYLEKVQAAWTRYSEAYRHGEEATQREIIRRIQRAAGAGYARAATIANTETTYYWNRARRDVYDQAPDVVAYLFVAIRDMATTHWCKSRQGAVLMKGHPALTKNTPPCHWQCRSELLPLDCYNPRHLALINDMSRRPESMHFVPLPRGWNSRAA